MKILHIGNPNSLNIRMYILEFSRMGNEVHTVDVTDLDYDTNENVIHHNIGRKRKKSKDTAKSISKNDKKIRSNKKNQIKHWFARKYYYYKLKKIVNEVKPDVIHGHEADGNGKITASFGRYPRVLTCWGSDIHRIPFESEERRKVIQDSLHKVDLIHVSNEDFKKNIVDTFGIKPDKIVNISFGLDISDFDRNMIESNRLRKIRGKYGIPDSARVLLYPAGFRNSKLQNYVTILKSFVKIKDHSSRPHLVMLSYGKKSGMDEITDLMEKKDLWERVTIIDDFIPYEEMPYLYYLADIMFLVHDVDQLAKSIPESMLMGCLLILSKIPPYQSNFSHMENCLFVDQKDVSAMVDTTIYAIENHAELMKRFDEKNIDWVKKKYGRDSQNRKIMNMYESLLR